MKWNGETLKGPQKGDIYAGDLETIDGVSFWRSYGEDGKEYIRCSDPDKSYLVEGYYP